MGYVLDERREANRLRRETALKPLEEKQSAFRDAYHKLIDLVFALNKLSPGQAGGTPLKEKLDNFGAAIGLVII